MKCYKISQVPEHLSKIDDLYKEYKATVEEQRLMFEQSMLCDYLIKSLPDSYYLSLRQSFCSKSHKDKELLQVMTTAAVAPEQPLLGTPGLELLATAHL